MRAFIGLHAAWLLVLCAVAPAEAASLPAKDERCVAAQQVIPAFYKSEMGKGGRLGRELSRVSVMAADPAFDLTQLWFGKVPPSTLAQTWRSSQGESLFDCVGLAERGDIAGLIAPDTDERWLAADRSHALLHSALPVIDKTGTRGMVAVEVHAASWPGSFGMILFIEKRGGVWVEAGRRMLFNT